MMGVKLASVALQALVPRLKKGVMKQTREMLAKMKVLKLQMQINSDKLPDIIYKPHEDHSPKILETKTILKDSPS